MAYAPTVIRLAHPVGLVRLDNLGAVPPITTWPLWSEQPAQAIAEPGVQATGSPVREFSAQGQQHLGQVTTRSGAWPGKSFVQLAHPVGLVDGLGLAASLPITTWPLWAPQPALAEANPGAQAVGSPVRHLFGQGQGIVGVAAFAGSWPGKSFVQLAHPVGLVDGLGLTASLPITTWPLWAPQPAIAEAIPAVQGAGSPVRESHVQGDHLGYVTTRSGAWPGKSFVQLAHSVGLVDGLGLAASLPITTWPLWAPRSVLGEASPGAQTAGSPVRGIHAQGDSLGWLTSTAGNASGKSFVQLAHPVGVVDGFRLAASPAVATYPLWSGQRGQGVDVVGLTQSQGLAVNVKVVSGEFIGSLTTSATGLLLAQFSAVYLEVVGSGRVAGNVMKITARFEKGNYFRDPGQIELVVRGPDNQPLSNLPPVARLSSGCYQWQLDTEGLAAGAWTFQVSGEGDGIEAVSSSSFAISAAF